ncbi:MAG: MarR family transcriptional regulator [Chloroflexi bacterium]|nr:MarR family transcriptional regulator [Chloroflexota bacterium]
MNSCDPYQLIEALMHSGKSVETQLDAALAAVELSAARWNGLRHLTAAGGQLPLGQLAAKLSCVKSNATQLVDRLEAEKLVRRVPDPEDRRSILAEITPEGRLSHAAGLQVVRDFERQLLEDYQPEERLVLHKLLARLGGFEAVRT